MNETTGMIAFSPRKAAEASSLSLRTLMTAIASGELPSTKKGRRRLIFRGDLETYLRAAGPSSCAPTSSRSTRNQSSRRSGTRQRG